MFDRWNFGPKVERTRGTTIAILSLWGNRWKVSAGSEVAVGRSQANADAERRAQSAEVT